jgi:hypothetical protein
LPARSSSLIIRRSRMTAEAAGSPIQHGASQLSRVIIDAYNAELRSEEGFVGDRASKRAFEAILDDWRERLRKVDADPLGETATDELSKKKLDQILAGSDMEAAALIHGAVEDFAQELSAVVRRFLRLKAWRKTQRIAIGGGLRASRVGELAIARASVLLKAEQNAVELVPIRDHPDEAGLVGSAHLVPSWMFKGHDALLAADIGGSNIRTGIVEINLKKAPDLSAPRVMGYELWRHRDDSPSREESMERLGKMLKVLARRAAKDKLRLAPFVGIGCPGIIEQDGTIKRGGQNLPGNWESSRFNLPARIKELLPRIDDHETLIVMHNDAVVQGLSQVPFMSDVKRWGILTIGTGLGNARFTNRPAAGER